MRGRFPSGQREQTVNLPAHAFGGSNPPLPTKRGRLAWESGREEQESGSSSVVEHRPSKPRVAGSNPVSRSRMLGRVRELLKKMFGPRGSVVEHVLGKDGVTGSIPVVGSRAFVGSGSHLMALGRV